MNTPPHSDQAISILRGAAQAIAEAASMLAVRERTLLRIGQNDRAARAGEIARNARALADDIEAEVGSDEDANLDKDLKTGRTGAETDGVWAASDSGVAAVQDPEPDAAATGETVGGPDPEEGGQ